MEVALHSLVHSLIITCGLLLTSHVGNTQTIKFPYKQAGLTEAQAAAHLLNRFTYGPKVGNIDLILKTGLEKWFKRQLIADNTDAELNRRLSRFDAINLTNEEALLKFPERNKVLEMAIKDGLMGNESVNKPDKKEYTQQLETYMAQNGLRPQQELFRQLISQKIIRAAYTNNQLQEVLTDFWFNHFNVALSKNQCAVFVPAYERDVIRANALGTFNALLISTAKSPAMLRYLDNFSSRVISNSKRSKTVQGLNENYAREVMELHTLGVDGGYTQQDVTQAARVLTGWTIFPMPGKRTDSKIGAKLDTTNGSIRDGDFYFAANRHDAQAKTVLGYKFEAGGGYEEGVKLLTMLANAPSTAQFISRKIAVRFVSDSPPQILIDKMSKTFEQTKGDIKSVLLTMVYSPEFWNKDALREKIKSPFELAISAVRALNADIQMPYQLNSWITKMGQRIYYYQAPTGFPDKGQYWINTGALLNRMNFGLALAMQKIPGVKLNLAALNNNHEPESSQEALLTYSNLIMPQRDLSLTIKQLTPILRDPELAKKVQQAAGVTIAKEKTILMWNEEATDVVQEYNKHEVKDQMNMHSAIGPSMLAQVIGMIIGSPEFQRR